MAIKMVDSYGNFEGSIISTNNGNAVDIEGGGVNLDKARVYSENGYAVMARDSSISAVCAVLRSGKDGIYQELGVSEDVLPEECLREMVSTAMEGKKKGLSDQLVERNLSRIASVAGIASLDPVCGAIATIAVLSFTALEAWFEKLREE